MWEHQPSSPGVTTCPECGNDVLQTEIMGRPRIYCSNTCKRRRDNRKYREDVKEAKLRAAALDAYLRERGH